MPSPEIALFHQQSRDVFISKEKLMSGHNNISEMKNQSVIKYSTTFNSRYIPGTLDMNTKLGNPIERKFYTKNPCFIVLLGVLEKNDGYGKTIVAGGLWYKYGLFGDHRN
jgi:hypothetical protein